MSTHSGDNGGECVAVANASNTVLIRDTKRPNGSVLRTPAETWRPFTAGLRLQARLRCRRLPHPTTQRSRNRGHGHRQAALVTT